MSESVINITDLYPGVIYSVVIIAFNEIGSSLESNVTMFKTMEEGLFFFIN